MDFSDFTSFDNTATDDFNGDTISGKKSAENKSAFTTVNDTKGKSDDFDGLTDISDLSEFADISDISNVSDFADLSDISDISDISNVSEFADISEFTDLSDISFVSDFADLSDISNVTDLPGTSEFTDISALSDISDLSNISNFANSPSPSGKSAVTNESSDTFELNPYDGILPDLPADFEIKPSEITKTVKGDDLTYTAKKNDPKGEDFDLVDIMEIYDPNLKTDFEVADEEDKDTAVADFSFEQSMLSSDFGNTADFSGGESYADAFGFDGTSDFGGENTEYADISSFGPVSTSSDEDIDFSNDKDFAGLLA